MAQTNENDSTTGGSSPPLKFDPAHRRVRVFFGDEKIADSLGARLLLSRRPPVYYFPQEDVRMDLLVESDHTDRRPSIGQASFWHVEAGERRAENAAWAYSDLKEGVPDLTGYVAFDWNAMDAWYEEDEQVFVHPKDPHVRVDALQSSRHIRIEVDGETVAESNRPVLLFETGLITRYYLPSVDVRREVLEESDSHTRCPYKGEASYYHVRVGGERHEDLVWYYPYPHPEQAKIQNLLSFYNERVDIYLDGELQERPETPFR